MALKSGVKISAVSLKELKENLSAIVDRVSNGDVVEIHKYNKPSIKMVPLGSTAIRVGKLVGRKSLGPAIKTGTGGKSLAALLEDRDE